MAKKKEATAEDPAFRKAHEAIVQCQVERFRISYKKYFDLENTEKLVKFFFEKIYDLEAQDTIIQIAINTYRKVKGQLADDTRENLENLIELNQLTNAMDRIMAEHLLKRGWKPGDAVSPELYFELFKEVGREAERREQLKSALKSMMVSYQLAHRPMNEMLLKAGKGFAIMFGVLPLYDFIQEGYWATKGVKGDIFNEFIDEVTEVELAYIVKAFGE